MKLFKRRNTDVGTEPSARDIFIAQLLTICQKAASGDLEARVRTFDTLAADPELVQIRDEFNRLLDQVDGFVRETEGALLAASDGRLYRAFLATGMAGVFGRAANQVDRARQSLVDADAAATMAAAARIELAAEYDSTVGSVAEHISTAAARLSTSATELADATTSAVSETIDARSRMDILDERSKEIERAVALISSIAAQTKLLALNATIEASRAGDAGKGFAVVADEVKQLAEATSVATEDIDTLVHAVQQAAAASSVAMASIDETVAGMSTLTQAVSLDVEGNNDAAAQAVTSSTAHYQADQLGLSHLTELLRTESQRFLHAMRADE